MKRLINYSLIVLLLGFFSVAIPPTRASAQEVSFQIFYDQLSPYGHWVEFPDEGYVWIPADQSGFAPYQSGGYWAYTDYGWTWVSDYSWGWAPFHYGRWDFDDDYGWYWVPDYEWSPAWVIWSREPGYYGWAPLRPGIEVNVAISGGYYAPPEHWCYVHEEFLGRRDMDRHFVPRSENNIHIRNSEMINKTFIDQERHTTYAGGPPREEVEKATGAPVQQLAIVPRTTPGQTVAANQVSIYKPVVAKTTASNPAPAPKLENIKDVKPLPGRTPNPEKLHAAPQIEQRTAPANPVQATPERNTPPPQQRQPVQIQSGQPAPQQRQQSIPQQNAPKENPQIGQQPRQQPAVQQNAPSRPQQSIPPRYQREYRYTAPTYQAPRPQAPQQQARPTAPPMQQSRPQSVPQHTPSPQGQQKQDGKPH